jgi:hypothetical protein
MDSQFLGQPRSIPGNVVALPPILDFVNLADFKPSNPASSMVN